MGHQSTHPLGDRCFVGLLGIQVVVEGQLKSIERLRRIGKGTNELSPPLFCLAERQTNLLQKATKQSWSYSDPNSYSAEWWSHALVEYLQALLVQLRAKD